MAYALSVTGTFGYAAIYDAEGNLQWWFRGQIGDSDLCGMIPYGAILGLFDTLPNVRPALVAPPQNPEDPQDHRSPRSPDS